MDKPLMSVDHVRERIIHENDYVVFDIEIRESPNDVEGSWSAKDKLGFACAVAWVNIEERFRLFDERNAKELVELLSGTPLVVGFNHVRFDYQVMDKSDGLTPERPCIPGGFDETVWPDLVGPGKIDFDLLLEIWKTVGVSPTFTPATHGKFGLDSVASLTLGPDNKKTGHGANAPYQYQKGEWAALLDYCQQDVKLTRDLFRYVRSYARVITEKGIVHL